MRSPRPVNVSVGRTGEYALTLDDGPLSPRVLRTSQCGLGRRSTSRARARREIASNRPVSSLATVLPEPPNAPRVQDAGCVTTRDGRESPQPPYCCRDPGIPQLTI